MTTYPGGKNGSGIAQTIINQIPPHSLYIEPFLGSGAVLRTKRPAQRSIAIDLNPSVVAAFPRGLIPHLNIFTGNALDYLDANAANFRHDTVIYLDPPYIRSSRRSARDIYKCEMTDAQHRRLLECIRSLQCYVLLSGYYSDLYARELATWRYITFQSRTRGGNTAIEYLWMNYGEPFALHDYSYLGKNFRERERIKRKKMRWKNRLAHMKPLERYAILEAIGEARAVLDPIAESGEVALHFDLAAALSDSAITTPIMAIAADN